MSKYAYVVKDYNFKEPEIDLEKEKISNCTFNQTIGSVLSTRVTKEPRECKVLCENILLCSHFVWDPNSENSCTLKSGTVSMFDAVANTLGLKCGIGLNKVYTVPEPEELVDTRFDGELLGLRLNVSNVKVCIKICESEIKSCRSISFYQPTKTCFFYKNMDPPKMECSKYGYISATNVISSI